MGGWDCRAAVHAGSGYAVVGALHTFIFGKMSTNCDKPAQQRENKPCVKWETDWMVSKQCFHSKSKHILGWEKYKQVFMERSNKKLESGSNLGIH